MKFLMKARNQANDVAIKIKLIDIIDTRQESDERKEVKRQERQ